jgi:Spy/CpxP family protein refolding chaperone
MKKLTMICMALLTLAVGVAAAQPMPMMGARGHDQMLKRFGLTDDQVTQVTALLAKQRTESVPMLAQIKVLDAQIEQAMTSANTDLKAVNAMVDKKAQIRADIQKQFLAMSVQIHQIVGDQIFYEMSAAFKAHRRVMGQHWSIRSVPFDGPRADAAPQPQQ